MRFTAKLNICVLAIALLSAPTLVTAAGLGRLVVTSNLGQPFRAEIELVGMQSSDFENLSVRLAPNADFAERGVEYQSYMSSLRFSIEKRGARSFVRISSSQNINEAVVDFLVELRSPNGRLTRQYTSLLDPSDYTPPVVVTAPSSSPNPKLVKTAKTPTKAANMVKKSPSSRPQHQRKSKVSTVAPSAATADYRVRSGDTLSRLARRAAQPNQSLEAVMDTLYQNNLNAFQNGDKNQLIKGAPFNLGGDAGAMSTQDWQAHKQKVVKHTESIPATTAKPKTSNTTVGQVATTVTAPKPTPNQDVVKIGVDGKGLSPKQVQDLKDAEAKAAQEKMAQASAAQAAALVQKQQDEEKLKQLEAASAAAVASSAQAAASAPVLSVDASPVVAASAVASVVKASVPTPSPVEEESSMLNWLLPVGGLVAALGLGAFFFMRRKRDDAVSGFQDSILDIAANPNTSIGSTGGGVINTNTVGENSFLTDFSREGLGNIDAEEVDPVAEAEVYLAYNKMAQAEEILVDALSKDAQRHEVRFKLLEVYAQSKNVAGFAAQAKQLRNLVGAQSDVWKKTADLGRTIDPLNAMYQPVAVTMNFEKTMIMNAVPVAPVAFSQTSALSTQQIEAVLSDSELDFELDLIEEAPVVEAKEKPTSNTLDFSVGTTSFEAMPDLLAADKTVQQPAVDLSKGLDFNFSLDTPANNFAQSLETLNLNLDVARDHEIQDEHDSAPLDGMSLQLESVDFETSGMFAELPDLNMDDNGDLDLSDPVDTKLDLARAYLSMSDEESAREILQEVLSEGNEAQQAEAKSVLDNLG